MSVSEMRTGQSELRSGIFVLERKIDRLIKISVCSVGSKKFGESTAIGHTASGLDELVYLISLGNHKGLNPRMPDKLIAVSNAVADALTRHSFEDYSIS
jgi:hypothetical protein